MTTPWVPLLLAAPDSPEKYRRSADLVVPASRAEKAINGAIASVRSNPGRITMAPGTYTIGGSIRLANRIDFQGSGLGTVIEAADNTNDHLIILESPDVEQIHLHDFLLNGRRNSQSSGHGIFLDNIGRSREVLQGEATFHRLANLYITGIRENAIHLRSTSDGFLKNHRLHQIRVDRCDGIGYYLDGTPDTFATSCHVRAAGLEGWLIESGAAQLTNCKASNCGILDNTKPGFRINGGQAALLNCRCEANRGPGFQVEASQALFVGCRAINSGQGSSPLVRQPGFLVRAGVGANPVYCVGCSAIDDNSGDARRQSYGLQLESGVIGFAWLGGTFDNNFSGAVNDLGATDPIIRHSLGYVTENSGTATIPSGSTTVVVSHGLGRTPVLADIIVTPNNNLGLATKFWVSAPTATQFTINATPDPGAGGALFAWQAVFL